MSETWLKPPAIDDLVRLPGYSLLRVDRVGKGGRGIGVYVREGLSVGVLASSPIHYCGQPEYLLVRVSAAGQRPFLLAIDYRPPKLGYLINFQQDFEKFLPSFPAAIVVGDFNIDLNRQSFDASSLCDFCDSNHLYIVPFANTHHTAISHSRIDHCLASDRSFILTHFQFALSFLSGHDLIGGRLQFQPTSASRHLDSRSFGFDT